MINNEIISFIRTETINILNGRTLVLNDLNKDEFLFFYLLKQYINYARDKITNPETEELDLDNLRLVLAGGKVGEYF